MLECVEFIIKIMSSLLFKQERYIWLTFLKGAYRDRLECSHSEREKKTPCYRKNLGVHCNNLLRAINA